MSTGVARLCAPHQTECGVQAALCVMERSDACQVRGRLVAHCGCVGLCSSLRSMERLKACAGLVIQLSTIILDQTAFVGNFNIPTEDGRKGDVGFDFR